MMSKIAGLSGLFLLSFSLVGQAEMYKYVDEQGRVSYSNVPIKGAKKIELAPITVVPSPKPKAVPSLQDAEREDGAKAAAAAAVSKETEARRKGLQDALAKEELLLVEAKQALKEGEEKPEVFRTTVVGKDGKPQVVIRRAAGRYEEKIKNLQDEVTLHEKNIEALKQELQALP